MNRQKIVYVPGEGAGSSGECTVRKEPRTHTVNLPVVLFAASSFIR
jgi:hypothetical protein